MTGLLLRRHPALGALRLALPMALLYPVIFALIGFGEPRRDILLLCCVLAAVLTPALQPLRPRLRFSEYELTLPVPGTTLFRVRMLGLLLLGLIPLTVTLLVYLALTRTAEAARLVFLIGPNVGAAILFGVAILHAPARGYARVPASRSLRWLCALALTILVAAFFVPSPLFALVVGVAAAAVLARTRRVPEALLLVGEDEPSRPDGEKPADTGAGRVMHRWLLKRTALSLIQLGGGFSAMVFAMVLVGLMPGAHLMMAAIVAFQPFVMTILALRVLREFAHLPLSPRRLFAYLVVPGLCWVLAGFLLGGALARAFPHDEDRVRVEEVPSAAGEFRYRIEVPDAYRRLSWRAKGRLLGVHNPYETGPQTSPDGFAILLSRALQDVHGVRVSPRELREGYVEVSADGTVGFHEDRARADLPAWRERPAGPRLPVRLLVFVVCWFLLECLAFRNNIPPATPDEAKRRQRRQQVGLGAVGGLVILVLAAADIPLVAVTDAAAGRFLDALVPPGPLAWVLAGACLIAANAILLRRFKRMEVPQTALVHES